MFCSGCCSIHEGHRQLHSHLRFGMDNLRDLSHIVTCLCESPITVPLASWLFSSCEEVQCITYSCGRKKSKSLQDSSVGCGTVGSCVDTVARVTGTPKLSRMWFVHSRLGPSKNTFPFLPKSSLSPGRSRKPHSPDKSVY